MFIHHRQHRRKRLFKKRSSFDKFVDLAAFAYPAVGIPQVIKVYQGNTDGVSLIYWFGTGVYSVIFLIYGIKHHTEPMIIIYGLWIVINLLVIIGLVTNSS